MRFYGFWRSSCSWRVRIALAYKGIRHEYVPVSLAQNQQYEEAFASRNTMRQVPVLAYEEGGVVRYVAQSMAILELLEELYPSPPLLPSTPYLRAMARQLAEMVNSGIQPFQNTDTQRKIREEYKQDSNAFARYFIERGLVAFEGALAGLSGRYCVGFDDVSAFQRTVGLVADNVVGPKTRAAIRAQLAAK
jgi:maleylpyruvate isomerase